LKFILQLIQLFSDVSMVPLYAAVKVNAQLIVPNNIEIICLCFGCTLKFVN